MFSPARRSPAAARKPLHEPCHVISGGPLRPRRSAHRLSRTPPRLWFLAPSFVEPAEHSTGQPVPSSAPMAADRSTEERWRPHEACRHRRQTGAGPPTRNPAEETMLRNTRNLDSFTMGASDGSIEQLVDLCSDDWVWVVRYLRVERPAWLTKRKILISSTAVAQPDLESRRHLLNLTKDQVEHSPDTPCLSRADTRWNTIHSDNLHCWSGGLLGRG